MPLACTAKNDTGERREAGGGRWLAFGLLQALNVDIEPILARQPVQGARGEASHASQPAAGRQYSVARGKWLMR
jgi:hypothetical protein